MNSLENFWMPFTMNKVFKERPKIFKKSKGMYYTSEDNRQILDASAGLWCVNAGHGHKDIVDAIKKQAEDMCFSPSFQLGHSGSFILAEKLAEIAPPDLNHIFFTNSGSEGVDTALKIALAYWQGQGKASKVRFIGRERGYHGVGFGGMSVGGIGANRKQFGQQLPAVDHLPHTHSGYAAFTQGQPEVDANVLKAHAQSLINLINLHDATNIAAVIVEPMAGSTGVLIPPKGYLQQLRDLCTKHNILLIFDEVITGYGRLGDAFASTHWGITPDIMITAKGITNGAIPMGAVFVKDSIYKQFVDNSPKGIDIFHGYTYSGHPMACAAGIATIDVYKREGLFNKAKEIGGYWQQSLHQLKDCKNVVDIRNYGLVGAIEFASRENAVGQRGYDVFTNAFFEQNLAVRCSGDIIALSPPLIVEKQHIDECIDKLRKAINAIE